MAFTVDLTENVGVAMPFDGHDRFFVVKKTVDFSVHNLANAEIMGLFAIPAGVLVREVLVKVITSADSDTTTFDIGSFTIAEVAIDADGFQYNQNPYQATVPVYVRDPAKDTNAAYAINDGTAGFVYTSDWILGFTNTDAQTLDHGVIEFIAVCIDLR